MKSVNPISLSLRFPLIAAIFINSIFILDISCAGSDIDDGEESRKEGGQEEKNIGKTGIDIEELRNLGVNVDGLGENGELPVDILEEEKNLLPVPSISGSE